ncbi:hypothetical protein NQ176_g10622 [Zarea fungicola]|uniref:Uncharacterized protein n=1 Tax=Zarea fungicola TaxID=93591 RepID=A0ACC1MF57_9HYPO|nr:hypothetical protein NQ176_g10622 [Lecanicillium fungicola]
MLEKLRVEREGRNSEQFKREFADKWFRKRPVPTYWRPPPSPPPSTSFWAAEAATRVGQAVDTSDGLDGASEYILAPTSEYVEEAGNGNGVIVVEGKHDNARGDETVAGAVGQLAERRDSAMQDGKGCLLGSTIAADGPSLELEKEFGNADMTQSLANTVIESSSELSEAASCEWTELYKPFQSLKIGGERS